MRAIAHEIGRSEEAVTAWRRALRLPSRRPPRLWSELEDTLLRLAAERGLPATELASRLGRPVESVRARRRQLQLAGPAAARYTDQDDAILRAHAGRPAATSTHWRSNLGGPRMPFDSTRPPARASIVRRRGTVGRRPKTQPSATAMPTVSPAKRSPLPSRDEAPRRSRRGRASSGSRRTGAAGCRRMTITSALSSRSGLSTTPLDSWDGHRK